MEHLPLPNKKYNIIYADPPWSYSDKGCNGAAEPHYSGMKVDDICSLPVKDIAADNFERESVYGDIEPGRPARESATAEAPGGVGAAVGAAVGAFCIQGNAIDRSDTAV